MKREISDFLPWVSLQPDVSKRTARGIGPFELIQTRDRDKQRKLAVDAACVELVSMCTSLLTGKTTANLRCRTRPRTFNDQKLLDLGIWAAKATLDVNRNREIFLDIRKA
jgi:hypothetical protein